MWEKLPTVVKVLGVAGVLLIAPVTILSIWLGGVVAGMVALLVFVLLFVVLYIVGVRRYSGAK